jgi:hypothetical protein
MFRGVYKKPGTFRGQIFSRNMNLNLNLGNVPRKCGHLVTLSEMNTTNMKFGRTSTVLPKFRYIITKLFKIVTTITIIIAANLKIKTHQKLQ